MNSDEIKPHKKRELTTARELIDWYPTVDESRCQG
ncbi:MAG: hypothetical protein H6Q71_2402, partial [Firmicutes bacterium]|nr:hypothetical protein [Bacillota bacterium]